METEDPAALEYAVCVDCGRPFADHYFRSTYVPVAGLYRRLPGAYCDQISEAMFKALDTDRSTE